MGSLEARKLVRLIGRGERGGEMSSGGGGG